MEFRVLMIETGIVVSIENKVGHNENWWITKGKRSYLRRSMEEARREEASSGSFSRICSILAIFCFSAAEKIFDSSYLYCNACSSF